MPQMSTTRRVHHAASEMFDLVADVERYPEFVPLCQSLRVRERRTETDREIIVADMTVAYKLLRETFASRVTLERPKLEILVEYLEGPFRSLNNRWNFRPVQEQVCDVEFFLAYEFRSRALCASDGYRVRRRLSAFCHGVRASRRPGLRKAAGLNLRSTGVLRQQSQQIERLRHRALAHAAPSELAVAPGARKRAAVAACGSEINETDRLPASIRRPVRRCR